MNVDSDEVTLHYTLYIHTLFEILRRQIRVTLNLWRARGIEATTRLVIK